MRHFIYLIFLGIIVSCSTETGKQTSGKETQEKIDQKDSVVEKTKLHDTTDTQNKSDEIQLTMTSENSYCYIKDIINQNDKTYLKVDFIQFFRFDEAIEEAKKRGDAEYDIDKNGDTTYFVYNDYYITDDNPKLRTFRLTDSTDFEFLKVLGDTTPNFKQSDEAMKRVKFSPFIIETRDGRITKLKEIYIP